MRKSALLFFGLLLISFYILSCSKPPTRHLPFANPENTAQEVVNLVVTRGNPTVANAGAQGEHIMYCTRLYDSRDIYEVCVGVFRDGHAYLEIGYYFTNRNFDNLGPRDVIAEELIYGRSEIYQEIHMWGDSFNTRVNMYQVFYRYSNGVWLGFTRRERDLGKRAGVKEYLFDQEKILHQMKSGKYKWIKASQKETTEIQKTYQNHLLKVKDLLLE